MGPSGRAACRDPSIEEITAPSEDDVLRVSTRYTDRVGHYEQYGALEMAEIPFSQFKFRPHQDLFQLAMG
jgi:hypothetical protein